MRPYGIPRIKELEDLDVVNIQFLRYDADVPRSDMKVQ